MRKEAGLSLGYWSVLTISEKRSFVTGGRQACEEGGGA